MILKHLFKTTRISHPLQAVMSCNRSFFSSSDDQNPVQGDLQTSQVHEVQEPSDANIQITSPSRDWKKKNRQSDKSSRNTGRDEEDNNELPVVSQFLIMKKPKVDIHELENVFHSDGAQKMEQILEKYQDELKAPLMAYEKRLNLNMKSLSQLRTSQPNQRFDSTVQHAKLGFHNGQQVEMVKQLLLQNQHEQLKSLYQNQFFKRTYSSELCLVISSFVRSNQNSGLLLNILYQNIQAPNFSSKDPVFINKVGQLLDMVRNGDLYATNPLKFYWFVNKTSPTLRSQLSLYMLHELKKLHFNGVNVESELSQLCIFSMRQKLCCKIISEIIGNTETLEEFLGVWAATLVVLHRVHGVMIQEIDLPQKLNLNDILLYQPEGKGNFFQQFFNNNLPKILFHNASPELFQVYQKGLKYCQENKKDFANFCYHSENHKSLNINFTKNLKVQYIFPTDELTLSYKFNKQAGGSQAKDQLYKSAEIKVTSAIVRGEYKKALDYYFSSLMISEKEYSEFKRIVDRAKLQNYEDQNYEALHALRELARKATYTHDPSVSISNDLLSKSFSKGFTSDRDSKKYSDRFRSDRPERFEQKNDKRFPPKRQYDEELQNTENSQKVPNKEKGGFFGKPAASGFCSSKQLNEPEDEKSSQEEQTQHYQQYLKIAKETKEAAEINLNNSTPQIFNFSNCSDFGEVNAEFQKNVHKITHQNLADLLDWNKNIPVVESLSVLVKYYFLKRTNSEANQPEGLLVSFNSSLGAIEKNYGQYIADSYFSFSLTESLYLGMLFDQSTKFNRKQFKKICAHLLCHSKQISNELVKQICRICSKQKIGITLLEIMHLINLRKIGISYDSLKVISESVQKYRNMESDLVQFLKGYSENTGTSMETALFEQYIANLTVSEQYEKLNEFLQTLRFQLRVKDYKLNSKLNPEENIAAEEKHKKDELSRFNRQNFAMLQIISRSFKPRTQIPNFIPEMYQVYLSQKPGQFDHNDLGIGLLLNGRNEEQFLNTLLKIKQNPKHNNDYILNCGIRVLSLFARPLKPHIEKILSLLIYERKASLTIENLTTLGFVFKDIDMPNVFSEFLEYLLKTQIETSQQVKAQYYKIFNSITDDYSKNQISGLLDFIFNANREKERNQFKKVKEEQEKKSKILREMSESKVSQTQKKEETANSKTEQKKQDKLSKKEKKKIKKQQKGAKQGTVAASPAKKNFDDARLVYTPKLSLTHMRNRPLRMFLSTFMKRYEPVVEGMEEQKPTKQQQKGSKAKSQGKKK